MSATASEGCEGDSDDMPPPAAGHGHTRRPVYTFSAQMTPLSFSSHDASPRPSSSLISTPPTSPLILDDSSSPVASMSTAPPPRAHGKRRDPSYIPRPPNAFILFRCAFIKDQNIPGKVEGNHSRLSKIIGLCWKQLAPEEREKWEAQAVIAQAEHRANYPDWRFRPGANAAAKLKVKEVVPATTRRRSVRGRAAKDTPTTEDGDDVVDAKGKGKMKSSHMISLEETRCAKIAGFVAEGIKGEELEVAVKQWEGDHKIPRATTKSARLKARRAQAKESLAHYKSHSDPTSLSLSSPLEENPYPPSQNALADVPLTHMFKRAVPSPARLPNLKSPASDPPDSSSDEISPMPAEHPPMPQESAAATPTRTHSHGQHRDALTPPYPMPALSPEIQTTSRAFDPHPHPPHQLTWQEAEDRRRLEDTQAPDSWWAQKAEPHFGFDAGAGGKEDDRIVLSPQEMGYEMPPGGSQFDRGYLEQYGPYDTSQDAGQPQWKNMSGSDAGNGNTRQGLTIVLEDPYADDCGAHNSNSTSNPSPPMLSLSFPPPSYTTNNTNNNNNNNNSNSNYYFPDLSQHPPGPPSGFPSSFSTLQGWAGEYKYEPASSSSDMRSWQGDASAGSQWYPTTQNGTYPTDTQNAPPWGAHPHAHPHPHPPHHPPQLQHVTLAHDADDWDRLEYRTSAALHLPVAPPREVTFHDELRRMQVQRDGVS